MIKILQVLFITVYLEGLVFILKEWLNTASSPVTGKDQENEKGTSSLCSMVKNQNGKFPVHIASRLVKMANFQYHNHIEDSESPSPSLSF